MNLLRSKGVTLAETLIAVAVIAVFAVIAFPSFTSSNQYQVDLASKEISAAIQFARSEAMRTNDVYGVDIDRTTTQITVYKANLTTSPLSIEFIVTHPINKNAYDYNLDADFGYSSVEITNSSEPFLFTDSVARKSILFNGNGIPFWIDTGTNSSYQLQSGDINLNKGALASTVSVQPFTGRVFLQ